MFIFRRRRHPETVSRTRFASISTLFVREILGLDRGKIESQGHPGQIVVPTKEIASTAARIEAQALDSDVFRYPKVVAGNIGIGEVRAPASSVFIPVQGLPGGLGRIEARPLSSNVLRLPRVISGGVGRVEALAPASDVTVSPWAIPGSLGRAEAQGPTSNIKILPKQVLSIGVGGYESRPRVSSVVIPSKVVDSDVGMIEMEALPSTVVAKVSLFSFATGKLEMAGAGAGSVRVLAITSVEGRATPQALALIGGEARGRTTTRWTDLDRDTGTWSEY
jgi:hypothetical protein